MRKVTAVLAAVCMLAAFAAAGEEVRVPVTKVTSFRSGVAYYEHNGTVKDDAKVLLNFKTEQVNDILKSLVLIDQKGGDFTVSYASRDPVARALKSFGIDISGNPTLAQLLDQIRGTQVVVSTPDRITGKILGVEKKKRHIVPSNTIIEQEVLNLVTEAGIKSIPFDTISDIALAEEKLNTELNKALGILAQGRDTEKKPVEITFSGKGERAVSIGYINEAPIWRTSYRLVLGDRNAEKAKDKALMQGWAIVENTSDFDWEKVQLTLVAGRPISFIEDLYTPLYVPRPVVRPELYTSLRPQTYAEGIDKEVAAKRLEAKDEGARMRESRAFAMSRAAAPAEAVLALEDEASMAEAMRAAPAAAAGAAVGELFSYRVKTPVTLARQRSAMIPIINQDVAARKVSIYNASVLATNPLNGFWLTNETDLSLLAGPVTVYDEGTYAGDAQLGNLSPKEKRLLSYAIDLKVRVDSSVASSARIFAAKINKGVLNLSRRHEFKQEYVIKNKADKQRTMLIEHPRVQNRKLVKPAEPLEKTENLYRFEVDVPANETGKFEVVEEHIEMQTVAILPMDINTLVWYSRNSEIPQNVRDAMAEAAKRKSALTTAERQLQELERQAQAVRTEQGHVRSNMGAVDRASPAYQRFEKKLLELETKIEGIQGQVIEKRDEVERLRKALEDYVNELNVG